MKKQKKVTAFLASLLLVLSLVMPGNFIQVEAATGDMGDIDAILDHFQKGYAVVGGKAALRQFAAGDAIFNQQFSAHSFPNGVENHNGELGAILQGTSELVLPGIELWGEHLGQH